MSQPLPSTEELQRRLESIQNSLQAFRNESSPKSSTLGAGAVAGIAIAVVVVVMLVIGGVCYSCRDSMTDAMRLLGKSPARAALTAKSAQGKGLQVPKAPTQQVQQAQQPQAAQVQAVKLHLARQAQLQQQRKQQSAAAAKKASLAKARQNSQSKAGNTSTITAPRKFLPEQPKQPAVGATQADRLRPAAATSKLQASRLAQGFAKSSKPGNNKSTTKPKVVSFAAKAMDLNTNKPINTTSSSIMGKGRTARHTRDDIVEGVRMAQTATNNNTQLGSDVITTARRKVSPVYDYQGVRKSSFERQIEKMRDAVKAGIPLVVPVGAGRSQAFQAVYDKLLEEEAAKKAGTTA